MEMHDLRKRMERWALRLMFMALPTTATVWLALQAGDVPALVFQGQLVPLVGEALGLPLILGSMAKIAWAGWLALVIGAPLMPALVAPAAVLSAGIWLYGIGRREQIWLADKTRRRRLGAWMAGPP